MYEVAQLSAAQDAEQRSERSSDGAECEAPHWLPYLDSSQLGFEFLASHQVDEDADSGGLNVAAANRSEAS